MSRGKANRDKGHRLERRIAKIFQEMGFPFAKTTRASSRLLDSCKVDINFVPFNIQCKAGYQNNRPKFEDIYNETNEKLIENFPPGHEVHDKPIVLIHKGNKRGKQYFQWVFAHDDIVNLLTDYYDTKQQLQTLKEEIARNTKD